MGGNPISKRNFFDTSLQQRVRTGSLQILWFEPEDASEENPMVLNLDNAATEEFSPARNFQKPLKMAHKDKTLLCLGPWIKLMTRIQLMEKYMHTKQFPFCFATLSTSVGGHTESQM